ncbi:DNA helicase [Microbacterium sp. 1P10UB]|uniref:DNA helicase n=1 Tax=unclassified Microbacterium TaxID=2609290 RepID=UPI0039A12712
MSLSRKRKKELHKLQSKLNDLWESQQVIVDQAGHAVRDAGRQLGNYGREEIVPTVRGAYGKYAEPVIDRSAQVSRRVLSDKVIPGAGAVVGSALSIWDAAGDTRARLAAGKGLSLPDGKKYAKRADKYGKQATRKLSAQLSRLEPKKKGMGAGGVIAILLGVAAAAGVAYAAWQTLRADDELWVADDPLRAPDA